MANNTKRIIIPSSNFPDIEENMPGDRLNQKDEVKNSFIEIRIIF
jgi:hypothetical protein